MHTSKMIPGASSWIIKFPKVPFAHRILRDGNTSRMNHGVSAGMYGTSAGEADRKENMTLVFYRIAPTKRYWFSDRFFLDSAAGRCGALSTGDRRATERIVGFAMPS